MTEQRSSEPRDDDPYGLKRPCQLCGQPMGKHRVPAYGETDPSAGAMGITCPDPTSTDQSLTHDGVRYTWERIEYGLRISGVRSNGGTWCYLASRLEEALIAEIERMRAAQRYAAVLLRDWLAWDQSDPAVRAALVDATRAVLDGERGEA